MMRGKPEQQPGHTRDDFAFPLGHIHIIRPLPWESPERKTRHPTCNFQEEKNFLYGGEGLPTFRQVENQGMVSDSLETEIGLPLRIVQGMESRKRKTLTAFHFLLWILCVCVLHFSLQSCDHPDIYIPVPRARSLPGSDLRPEGQVGVPASIFLQLFPWKPPLPLLPYPAFHPTTCPFMPF